MPKIIYTEDWARVGAAIQEGLELSGYELIVCSDVPSALEAVSQESYEAALLDLNLGNQPMGGVEIARAIFRVHLDWSPGRVVFLTALPPAQIPADVAGCKWLVKPIRLPALDAALQAALAA